MSAPASLVVIHTSSFDTAKCTRARVPKPSSGSPAGLRSVRYCALASFTDWVKSVFNSAVATGMPFTNNTRSSELLFFVE